MSGRLVSAVFNSTLPAWLKPYAATYASFAAEDGSRCYPSVARVAKMVGRSERATQTALQQLRRRGVLVLEQSHAPRRSSRYCFNQAALPQLSDPGQLPLFAQGVSQKFAEKPEEPEFFHSHAQAYTRSGLHLRGEVGFTRSVIDPSVSTYSFGVRARGTGKRQKTGTDE